jgi:hypothetical protein
MAALLHANLKLEERFLLLDLVDAQHCACAHHSVANVNADTAAEETV